MTRYTRSARNESCGLTSFEKKPTYTWLFSIPVRRRDPADQVQPLPPPLFVHPETDSQVTIRIVVDERGRCSPDAVAGGSEAFVEELGYLVEAGEVLGSPHSEGGFRGLGTDEIEGEIGRHHGVQRGEIAAPGRVANREGEFGQATCGRAVGRKWRMHDVLLVQTRPRRRGTRLTPDDQAERILPQDVDLLEQSGPAARVGRHRAERYPFPGDPRLIVRERFEYRRGGRRVRGGRVSGAARDNQRARCVTRAEQGPPRSSAEGAPELRAHRGLYLRHVSELVER